VGQRRGEDDFTLLYRDFEKLAMASAGKGGKLARG
jgi:hypothetical protein